MKISIFYSIFYAVLAVLIAICMWVFLQTLDPRTPKWKLDESLIGTSPGLGFRPMPPINNISSMIWYNSKDYHQWTDALDDFLKRMENIQQVV